jgi:hypothetical protein
MLTDGSGGVIDQVTLPSPDMHSYGRIGGPPYNSWGVMTPSPGKLNRGQEIPELSPVLASIAIVPIVMIAIRCARTRNPRKPLNERGGAL